MKCPDCKLKLIKDLPHTCIEKIPKGYLNNEGMMQLAKWNFEEKARQWEQEHGEDFWDTMIPPGTKLLKD